MLAKRIRMKQVSFSEQRVKEGFVGQKMLIIPKNIRRTIKKSAYQFPLFN